jgi:hypothetical protein
MFDLVPQDKNRFFSKDSPASIISTVIGLGTFLVAVIGVIVQNGYLIWFCGIGSLLCFAYALSLILQQQTVRSGDLGIAEP